MANHLLKSLIPIVQGSTSAVARHFVAVGQELTDVHEFGVYADDLVAICTHLKENGITSVAMESTGAYWQNLYVELVKHGFEVVLANGKFTKKIKGKKD